MACLRNTRIVSQVRLNRIQGLLLLCVISLGITYLWVIRNAQVSAANKFHPSSDGVWQPLSTPEQNHKHGVQHKAQALTLKLDQAALTRKLSMAARETGNSILFSQTTLELPLPSGEYITFKVEESPVLDDKLAANFPEIKSYHGVGISDATITMRADWTPQGFHALVVTPQNTFSIHPANSDSEAGTYLSYETGANPLADEVPFACGSNDSRNVRLGSGGRITSVVTNTARKDFRLALAATWEYCNTYGGGTTAGTVSSLNTWVNGVNAIYERELNIRFILVNNTAIIYSSDRGFSSSSDPYSNGDTYTMLGEIRPDLRDKVGAGNYDVGHALGTGGGGVAWVGVVCSDSNINGDSLGPAKGGGVSCVSGALGNSAALNVILHELGHQFGAAHSFNGTSYNCGGGNRSASSSVEPGSGSTIMSYAGLCSGDNITGSSSLRFHAWSFAQILNYVNARTCYSNVNTGNTPPTVNGGSDYSIPKLTPFELTATGNDADAGDVANLTYSWEQVDVGGSNYSNPPYNDGADPDNSTRPLFRSYGPTTTPNRPFPNLEYILNYDNNPPEMTNGYQTADFLPRVNRSMKFRTVVRDQRGGVVDDEVVLNVVANAGPFAVTSPNTAVSWTGGTLQTVTWNVNNTNNAPINCANVRILLSTDGGQTFPHVLASNTPNDGSQTITVPNGIISTTARVRVQAEGNVFFDISNANFTLSIGGSCLGVTGISPNAGAVGTAVTISGANFSGVTSVLFGNVNATFTVLSNSSIQATVPAGASGGPIKISKAGCSDVQTEPFAFCSSPATSLQIDDGTFENSVGYSSGVSYFVNRLTPSAYPATLNAVTVAVNRAAGTPFEVVVGTNTDGNNSIDGTTFQAVSATVSAQGQLMTISVPSISISSGDFVVGYRIMAVGGTYPGTYDNSSGSQQRSYASNSGTSFSLMDTLGFAGNLGVRAAVFAGTCSTSFVSCPVVSGTSPGSGTYSSTVTISGSGFTGVTGVSFANNLPASFTVNSDSQITATVPTGAVTGAITLSKSGCSAVQTASFTVTPPLHNPVTTGVFRPTNGNLYLKNQNSTGFADWDLVYGLPGDQPVVGDWDGDGIDSIGIYRNGMFYLRNSNTTGFADIIIAFGSASDQPVAGDWNGDGIDTIGIYRNGVFFLRNSLTTGGPDLTITVGSPGDIGIAGDWNGDGIDTVGVFRPTNGNLYLRNTNTTGVADLTLVYGLPGDQPVVGDWDGNGTDTIGVKRGQFFYLRNSNTSGVAEIAFVLGLSSDVPIAGDWDGQP